MCGCVGRFDAHLTAEGWRQAEDLNSHIVSSGLQVDLVVVSPMMRALETAVGAFGRWVVHGLVLHVWLVKEARFLVTTVGAFGRWVSIGKLLNRCGLCVNGRQKYLPCCALQTTQWVPLAGEARIAAGGLCEERWFTCGRLK